MADDGGRSSLEKQAEQGADVASPWDIPQLQPIGGTGGEQGQHVQSDGQLVCWLASAMPLEDKIAAAVTRMPLRRGRADECSPPRTGPSPRLANAVLQFAANALLRATPAAATAQDAVGPARSPVVQDERQRGFLDERLWALAEQSLHTQPYEMASTVSGIGGHLVRPLHAALMSVMASCQAVVEGKEAGAAGTVDWLALARSVRAVLSLLRGPHAASFSPQLTALCSMIGECA